MFWLQRSFWVLPVIVAAILGIFSAVVVHNHRLRSVYKQHFVESRRERLFLAFLGFFIAAAVTRGITLAIHHDIGPFNNVTMRGRHIHHLVCRLLLLKKMVYIWLVPNPTGDRLPS